MREAANTHSWLRNYSRKLSPAEPVLGPVIEKLSCADYALAAREVYFDASDARRGVALDSAIDVGRAGPGRARAIHW
jgi:hypothetical protein